MQTGFKWKPLKASFGCSYKYFFSYFVAFHAGSLGSCSEEEKRLGLLGELTGWVGGDVCGTEGGRVFASFLPGIAMDLCKLMTSEAKVGQVRRSPSVVGHYPL